MADEFKPGDVVVLKSGGPLMTVLEVGGLPGSKARVYCSWFDGKNEKHDNWPPEALKHPEG